MNGLQSANRRTVLKTIGVAAVGGGVAAGTTSAGQAGSDDGAHDSRNVVEVVGDHDHEADEHQFTLSVDEVPSGWLTLEFENRTDHTHFAYLARLPQAAVDEAEAAGENLREYYIERVTDPFQWLMDDIDPEKEPDPEDRFSDEVLFPEWFGDVLPSGGTGLNASHRTARTTLNLDPGEYIVECYVKNADSEFHSYLGMLETLTVTDEECEAEPESDLDLSLSSDGIDAPDSIEAGEQTVAVQFDDQRVYDHDLGHDVHLIRLDEETAADDVNGWMNWMDPAQFVSDGNEPGTFLGGVQDVFTTGLLEGTDSATAYVHLDLKPGDYAWVSEVPTPRETGHLREFSVPFPCCEADD